MNSIIFLYIFINLFLKQINTDLINLSNFFDMNKTECYLMENYLEIRNWSDVTYEIRFQFFHKYIQFNPKCLKLSLELSYKFKFYSERKIIIDNSYSKFGI